MGFATDAILVDVRGVAQPGRAPGSGPGGRRFESFRPDQITELKQLSSSPYRPEAGIELLVLTFNDYVSDRKYLKNVSPKTLAWYTDVWRAFGPFLNTESAQTIKDSIRGAVPALMARGIKPVSINSWLTGIRAYCLWLYKEGQLKEKPEVKLLKYEKTIIATFSKEQAGRLISFRPQKLAERRIHALTLLVLDTGLRLNEALTLLWERVDFDNLVLKVRGKGDKQRLVPFSFECRKVLFKWRQKQPHTLVFGSRNGTPITPRNALRDFKLLGKKAAISGVRCSPHTLRHTFAITYLRNGGNLFYLSKSSATHPLKLPSGIFRALGLRICRRSTTD
jgi:integrase/recombinase XerD